VIPKRSGPFEFLVMNKDSQKKKKKDALHKLIQKLLVNSSSINTSFLKSLLVDKGDSKSFFQLVFRLELPKHRQSILNQTSTPNLHSNTVQAVHFVQAALIAKNLTQQLDAVQEVNEERALCKNSLSVAT
jgi:hypothetical protein